MIKKNLLIIDDNPEFGALLNEALRLNGFAGDVVVDSIIGLLTYRNNMNAYGEVICDVRMLGKSGLEVGR